MKGNQSHMGSQAWTVFSNLLILALKPLFQRFCTLVHLAIESKFSCLSLNIHEGIFKEDLGTWNEYIRERNSTERGYEQDHSTEYLISPSLLCLLSYHTGKRKDIHFDCSSIIRSLFQEQKLPRHRHSCFICCRKGPNYWN